MIIIDLHAILNAEPCKLTGELRFWRDVGEDGEGKLVWEFENCEDGTR